MHSPKLFFESLGVRRNAVDISNPKTLSLNILWSMVDVIGVQALPQKLVEMIVMQECFDVQMIICV